LPGCPVAGGGRIGIEGIDISLADCPEVVVSDYADMIGSPQISATIA
jgi:hypothetical protein